MGVNTFLLDRRTATLAIGGSKHTVGTLRRFFKITEMNEDRAAERDAAARITPSPAAVLVMDITELPLASAPDKPIAAHLVLGWDEGRGSVTDFGWDYLPQLGYGVREGASGRYILHEERDGLLRVIDERRALELDLLSVAGELVPHGQPRIVTCRSVRPYIPGFAEADCTLDDGREEKLLVRTADATLPEPAWLAGKKPMEVESFRPKHRSGSASSDPHP